MAQNVGIGTTSPDSSAMLDISSTSKGLLMPRLTTAQMTAIANPATGLAVYNTDSSTICIYMGSAWRKMVLGDVTISETDPKVGTLSNHYLPKWNGSSLTNSAIYDSVNRISIGLTNPNLGDFFDYSRFTIASANGDSSDFNNVLAENTVLAPWINWGKARGTLATPLSVQSGDQLFSLGMHGYDSSGYQISALIQTTVDGSPSIGKVPSRMGFYTTSSGGTSPSERLRITSAGRIGIGTSSPQSLLANTGTNIVGANGQGTNSNSLTWAMNSTGFVSAFYNSSTSANAQGLAIKTAATASTNRLLDLSTGSQSTAGSTVMVVQADGKMGIGTTAPTQKLHVKGSTVIDSGRIQFANMGNAILIGDSTGYADDFTNNNSIFMGYRAGRSNINGVDNIAIGYNAFSSATASNYNIAIGENVLSSSSMSGNLNVAIGNFAMVNNTTGYNNNAFGQDALGKNTTGNNNMGIGNNALDDNTTGRYNTALGVEALPNATTGESNVSVGYFSAAGLYGGSNNVFVGYSTSSNTSSSNNTVIGSQAGSSLLGSGNVIIGYQAGFDETGSNKLIINNSVGATPLVYGDFATKKLTINDSLESKYLKLTHGATNGYVLQSDANGIGTWVSSTSLAGVTWTSSGTNQYSALSGNVGIGTASPSFKLDVQGTGTTAANVQSSSGSANVNMAAAAGQEASLVFKTYSGSSSTNRWAFGKSTTPESTADAGANFFINRYSDAGSYTGQPLAIARSTGTVTLGQDLADATANTVKINGSMALKVNAFSNTGGGRVTNMDGDDYAVIIGGNAVGNVVNLPTASTVTGRIYLVVNHAANDLTITAYTTAFGVTSTSVTAGATLQVMSDGTLWHKIN